MLLLLSGFFLSWGIEEDLSIASRTCAALSAREWAAVWRSVASDLRGDGSSDACDREPLALELEDGRPEAPLAGGSCTGAACHLSTTFWSGM
jgi:hypothetical protein